MQPISAVRRLALTHANYPNGTPNRGYRESIAARCDGSPLHDDEDADEEDPKGGSDPGQDAARRSSGLHHLAAVFAALHLACLLPVPIRVLLSLSKCGLPGRITQSAPWSLK